MVAHSQGNLYGTTNTNGATGGGTVFELLPGGSGQWGYQVLYNFCSVSGCTDGGLPESSLIFDAAGNLYGTTYQGGNSGCGHGCGTVFKLTRGTGGTWAETVLYAFSGGSDGGSPTAGLVLDSAGNLYGTTTQGGDDSSPFCGNTNTGCGVIFELNPHTNGTWTERVLHTFCVSNPCLDGAFPYTGLTMDSAGNLYGTTSQGSTHNAGTAFRFSPGANGGWSGKLLHIFGEGLDGARPNALILDSHGRVYGTTNQGGAHGAGTVFGLELGSNGKWAEKILYSFCSSLNCTDGTSPYAGLIRDSKGNLYGTTYWGGGSGDGIVFELTPGIPKWTETVLYNAGGNPDSGLIFDSAGNLYGMNRNGGSYGLGSAYEITP